MNTRTTSTPTEYRDSLTSRKLLAPSNELFRAKQLANHTLRAKQLANHKSMQQKNTKESFIIKKQLRQLTKHNSKQSIEYAHICPTLYFQQQPKNTQA